jgi:hypothetical protein
MGSGRRRSLDRFLTAAAEVQKTFKFSAAATD